MVSGDKLHRLKNLSDMNNSEIKISFQEYLSFSSYFKQLMIKFLLIKEIGILAGNMTGIFLGILMRSEMFLTYHGVLENNIS
jgi:hypothetical protein